MERLVWRVKAARQCVHSYPCATGGHWGMIRPYIEAYAYAHKGGGKTLQDRGLYWRLSESMNATGQAEGDELPVPIGQWFTLAIEAEINTPGGSGGKLRVWLNGNQGIDLNDMQWVQAAPYQWTQTMFETFYNVGSHPATNFHLANMKFSDFTAIQPPPNTELGDVNGNGMVNGLDLSKKY